MHRHANHIPLLLHIKLPQWNLLLNLYCLVVQHHPENPHLEVCKEAAWGSSFGVPRLISMLSKNQPQ